MEKYKSRRQFLDVTIKATALLPLFGSLPMAMAKSPVKKLNILILGGTSFLGPHQIAYAMSRGHSISTFTRGKTKPTIHQELFENVEQLIGDRSDNLEALRGRKWDAVIDNSGHREQWTRDSAQLLKDNVGLYLYTSSTGVYYPYLGSNIKEDTELVLKVPDSFEDEDEKLEYGYGVMKSNSEIAARESFGSDRTIIVRPTYMIGPADRLDRFIHWPVRLSRGGEILVPGKSDDPVQYIDVRDVASWMIHLIEKGGVGTFNAVGPASATGMHAFIYGAHAAFSSPVSFVMVDDYDFLKKHKVPYIVPWIMPTGKNSGSALINNQHGIANGLAYTPLAQTVKETHDWWYSDALTEERRQRFESKPDSILMREPSIINDWQSRQ